MNEMTENRGHGREKHTSKTQDIRLLTPRKEEVGEAKSETGRALPRRAGRGKKEDQERRRESGRIWDLPCSHSSLQR